jgi:hypothetical protein
MALPYELIALDLDYTFLDAELRIGPRNRAAVRRCTELGVKVVITSGRMFRSTMRFVRELELETPAITYNGAYVKQESSGRVLLDEKLDQEVARELVDFCDREELNLNYYLDDTLYVAKITPWGELYSTRTSAPLHPVGDLRKLTDRAPTKVLIVAEPERIVQLRDELMPKYEARSYVTVSNVEYLEFMPRDADKGKALAVVADYYGIPRERTIAFGDADNDIPMIRWAGLGVAMENARPSARAAADRIAPRYDEDGVAVVLEELFELKDWKVGRMER